MEVLVVVTIMAILFSLVIAQITTIRAKARNAKAKNDITQAGKSVELFEKNNEKILIVQKPGAPYLQTSDEFATTCFETNICYPAHTISAEFERDGVLYQFNNGFTSELFNGDSSSTVSYNLKLTHAPNKAYQYTYMTRDCSFDQPVDGVHKFSSFPDYLLLTSLDKMGNSEAESWFWIRNGSPGSGSTSASIPFIETWTGNTYQDGERTVINCRLNYP